MSKISVVICTHNRAQYLGEALQSLTRQSLPKDQFEVLVINNRSSDETIQIAETYTSLLHLTLINEPRLGLSNARNRGLEACKTDLICFIDDDAIASEGYLIAVLDGFWAGSPPPVLLGGKVYLNWNGPAPTWLPQKYLSLYSMLDYGDQAKLLNKDEYLVGANFCAQTSFLRSIGGFQPALGRRGGMLLSGEETQVLHKARQAGFAILYQPSALIWHTVTPERKNKAWLQKRIFWDGASQPLINFGTEQVRLFYFKQSLIDLRRILRFGWDFCFGQKDAFYHLIQRAGRLRTNLLLWLGLAD